MKKYSPYLLFVFPALYLLLGFYFRQVFGDLSLRSSDPEYVHFVSAMCVATGKFGQANVDHPGSVYQLIVALIFKIIHFIRSNKTPFFEDAVAHADMYLAVTNLVITSVVSAAMLWAGKMVVKISNSTLYALLIQTAPFIIASWYEVFGRIYPEITFVIPIYLLEIQLLREIYQPKQQSNKTVFAYAFAISVGLSTKMTFLPLALLPLFVIKKMGNKLKYFILTIVLFFILSPQVAFQWHHFSHWMRGIFFHSGAYETGDTGIVNSSLFFSNLSKIVANEKFFFYAAAILLLLTIFWAFTKKRKTPLFGMMLGLTVALAGLVFIVSKQYAIRYFFPALLLYPFMFILSKETIQAFVKHKVVKPVLGILLVLIIGYQMNKTIPYIRVVSRNVSKQMNARIQTRDFIQTLNKNCYTIITSQDYGSPYPQYALMFGFAMSGQHWPNYKEKLDKLFPDNYIYSTWDNTIKYWGKPYNTREIASAGKPVYLYLQKNSKELYNRTVNKLLENSNGISISNKLLFENPVNHESIMQLYYAVDSVKTGDVVIK